MATRPATGQDGPDEADEGGPTTGRDSIRHDAIRTTMTTMERHTISRVALLITAVWIALVVGALVLTLQALQRTDFDGLNNILQIPLALPWFLIPSPPWSHEANAWRDAAAGLLNAVIIFVLVSRWDRRRADEGGEAR